MFDVDDIADELAVLRNQPSVWERWLDAMQQHFDWDPEEPDISLAIIQGLTEGVRL